ncbi:hypothetical protein [Streptomyces sp. UNOC14_S4]|uniref:hypothetical protein n=1 Tax=Streptomyces sp. UNOC14_S4 TaxID=2872340 RepID=UPI001E5C2F74|nr:hypothetical protein [Streptomyces sp. UNOC14_S4]MCC3767278.1 hypothetical protein [Streptomyces sp. UNOC14_S4]
MARKPKMNEEGRRAYGDRMRAELEAVMNRAYGAMVTSEDFWAEVMRTAAVLPDRSPINCVAIAAQRPGATRVLATGDWRKGGRYPVKGSTAIRIWTPIKRRSGASPDAPEPARDAAPQAAPEAPAEGVRVTGFKAAPVFDLSQTGGDDYRPPAPAHLPASVVRDLLIAQYRRAYGADPESAGPLYYPGESSDVAARILLRDHARRRVSEAEAEVPGQHDAEVASAAHVAARMLGIAPDRAVMPPLAGIIADTKNPPVHGSVVRVVEAARSIVDAVTTAADGLFGPTLERVGGVEPGA